MFMSVIILCLSAEKPLTNECMSYTGKTFYTTEQSCKDSTIILAPIFAQREGKELAWGTCIETGLFGPKA